MSFRFRRGAFSVAAGAFVLALSVSGPAAVRIRKHRYPPNLAEILPRMSEAGKRLRTLSASLETIKVTVAVDDKSSQSGKLYVHESKNPEILFKIEQPDPKTILLSNNKAQIYTPKINQIQEYNVGQQKELLEQFFLLGFGKGTQDLKKHYDVEFKGEEELDGDVTVQLELTPRKESDAEHVSKVILWVSEDSWLPVQQKFIEPGGDYMIARYRGVKVNRRLPSSIFEIDAPAGAKRVKMN